MLVGRDRAVGVALHARHVRDPQLCCEVLHHRPRHIQRVFQEPARPTVDDLDELRAAVEAFTGRLRSEPLREFYARPRDRHSLQQDRAKAYFATAIARLHAAHVLLFHIGQIDRPPTGRVDAGTWVQQLTPPGTPPQIRAVRRALPAAAPGRESGPAADRPALPRRAASTRGMARRDPS